MNNSILNKVFALFFDTVLTKIKNTSLTWTMKIAHPWASVSMLKVFWGFANKVWQSNLIEIKTELLHRIYKNSSCDPFLGFGLCFSVFLSQQPATPAVAGCWLIDSAAGQAGSQSQWLKDKLKETFSVNRETAADCRWTLFIISHNFKIT